MTIQELLALYADPRPLTREEFDEALGLVNQIQDLLEAQNAPAHLD
jgi:hypothetical protein